jgi:hypothetical protein
MRSVGAAAAAVTRSEFGRFKRHGVAVDYAFEPKGKCHPEDEAGIWIGKDRPAYGGVHRGHLVGRPASPQP